MDKKKSVYIGLVLAAIVCVAVAVVFGFRERKTEAEFFSMDTYVKASVKGVKSKEACREIQEMINRLDREILSRHNSESEISKLNSEGGKMSERMKKYLSVMLEISRASNGKFDFALGEVSDLWGFGENPHLPQEEMLKSALAKSGTDKISINGDEFSPNRATVDFGATGKGIALDEAREILDSMNAKEAVISVGGSVLLYGRKEFNIGIKSPSGNSGGYIIVASTPACCVSTSGNYEQRFEENGKAYHHILDPETGYPVDNGLVSVTVFSDNGLISDALSTACFVLGVQDGMKLCEKYGCKAVFVTEDKKIYASDDIIDSLKITDNDYSFAE